MAPAPPSAWTKRTAVKVAIDCVTAQNTLPMPYKTSAARITGRRPKRSETGP